MGRQSHRNLTTAACVLLLALTGVAGGSAASAAPATPGQHATFNDKACISKVGWHGPTRIINGQKWRYWGTKKPLQSCPSSQYLRYNL